MGNIKESFLKKYGVWEYFLFIVGATVLGYQVWAYIKGTLDGDLLDGIMALGAIFCVMAPMSLLDFARKKAGLETRSDKLDRKNDMG